MDRRSITSRQNARFAGRPKGSVSIETRAKLELRRQLTERVSKEYGAIMDAMLDSAKGHYARRVTETGEVKVYKKSPNVEMLKYLHDQIIGKPINSEEEKGGDTNILIVHSEHTNLMLNAFRNYGLIADTGSDTPRIS